MAAPAVFALAACAAWAAGPAPSRKVLLIGIDGLRSDALRRAQTPVLDSLAAAGAFSGHTLTAEIPRSGPGWTSVMTGVWHGKHGVRDNSFKGYRRNAYPTFFARLAGLRPGIQLGAVVNWSPLGTRLVGRDGFWSFPGSDEAVAEEAALLIREGIPDVLFAHFDAVDHAGHRFGFSPNMPFYLWAVERTDGLVARLVAAVRARAGEQWLILVTSDHGGTFRHHGKNIPGDRTVFLLASGPGCRPDRPEGFRGVVDVAPTVFAYLGLPVPPEWGWDGEPLGFPPVPAAVDTAGNPWARAANR